MQVKNILLRISYDGTNYLGWQKTKEGPSIEGCLERAIERITGQKVILQAASRTDAGVHAHEQPVNFYLVKDKLSVQKLNIGLNAVLPKDIVVRSALEVPPSFHPTLDAVGKEYHYMLSWGPTQSPKDRYYSWHYPFVPDITKMVEASQSLIGEHDFSAFCNVIKTKATSNCIRTVEEISLEELPEEKLCFKIRGNNFLYKMVRNIVGTLIYVGMGKVKPEDVSRILQEKDRKQAGVTAAAHGLSLHQVFYSYEIKKTGQIPCEKEESH